MGTPAFRSLVDVVRHRADALGDRLAYGFLLDGEADEARLSFAEVDRRARAIAARLQSLDAAGQRAVLLFPPGLDYITAFFGCLYAGVIAVPAYPPRNTRGLPRIKSIATDAGAALVLTNEELVARMRPMLVELPELLRLTWLATDTLDDGLADQWRPQDIGGDTVAFLQYTSGSTGEPKGVVLTHDNLLDNSAMISQVFKSSSESVTVSWLPPYHDMGLIGGILQPLYGGFTCWLMAPVMFLQRPLRWLQAISRMRATHSGGPDFAYDLCVRKVAPEQRAGLDLSSWRAAFNGAEPVRSATLARFGEAFGGCGFDARNFVPCYGLAEATLFVTGTYGVSEVQVDPRALERNAIEPAEHAQAVRLVSSGPLAESPGTCVVDPATGQPCAEGRVGEIWVRNPSVAQGYWRKPELSEQVFGARLADGSGPFLRTGDLGAAYGGLLYITGRIKDLIIVRGRNLYPTDIETVVQGSDAALRPGFGTAFGVEADGEERLVVLQELDFGQKPDLEATRQSIVRAVAGAFEIVPHAVALLKAGTLPVTSSGKLRRREARAMFLRGELSPLHEWRDAAALKTTPASASAPAGLAAMLAARIAARTGVAPETVDIDLPFTDFGLGSVEAVALSGELEQQLGRHLPPTLLWDHPSIRQLAAYLEGEGMVAPNPAAAPALLGEPIAVIGMACRFPGAPDLQAYWRLLSEGVDAISDVPADRWNSEPLYDPRPGTPGKLATRWGGFLSDIDAFDAGFFGIAAKEARQMDPQQRLLLETAWHALEHAGIAPASLAGSATGVYIGVSHSDHARRLAGRLDVIDAYAGTGNANSIAANRISYQLGLQGPSMAVDTACSSSLVSVHLACQSLRLCESDLALAGGVNVILEPDLTVAFSQAGMMAADGRCKTFDARADGYARGEGCGIVVLKRLSDAIRDGDAVLALLRGTAVNQSGRSNGLTAPSRSAQRAVIQRALSQAGIAPAEVGYVEAHGTGTALGDPIEIQALVEAVGGEGRTQPCALGSVKTNIGHLEAAAGIAGLIKTVLMLQHGMLVPHLHLQQLNPRLRRANLPLTVPRELQPWTAAAGVPRIAGVSSFGFGGSNAHVVLQEAPEAPAVGGGESAVQLFTLAARNEEALRELARRYREFFRLLPPERFADACFTANTGRSPMSERLCVLGANPADVVAGLEAYLQSRPDDRWQRGSTPVSALAAAEPPDLAAAGACEVQRRSVLRRLGGLWVAGASVDWADLHAGQGRRRMALPGYPFQRERHWVDAARPVGVHASTSEDA